MTTIPTTLPDIWVSVKEAARYLRLCYSATYDRLVPLDEHPSRVPGMLRFRNLECPYTSRSKPAVLKSDVLAMLKPVEEEE